MRSRYSHVLVPMTLDATQDRAALPLAAEIALLHRAKLTFLHVLPGIISENSMHWLDAIDGLHLALEQANSNRPGERRLSPTERVRREIKTLVDREGPAELLGGLQIEFECRVGEPADMIVKFAAEAGVDLIVMSSGPSRWWMSGLSGRVRRVLSLTQKQVIVARRDV